MKKCNLNCEKTENSIFGTKFGYFGVPWGSNCGGDGYWPVVALSVRPHARPIAYRGSTFCASTLHNV